MCVSFRCGFCWLLLLLLSLLLVFTNCCCWSGAVEATHIIHVQWANERTHLYRGYNAPTNKNQSSREWNNMRTDLRIQNRLRYGQTDRWADEPLQSTNGSAIYTYLCIESTITIFPTTITMPWWYFHHHAQHMWKLQKDHHQRNKRLCYWTLWHWSHSYQMCV